jgi:hypothetical protein
MKETIAIEGRLTDLKVHEVSRRDAKKDVLSALRLFREVFIMMPVQVFSFMLFTFPLSAPLLLVIVWLFMR